MNERKKIGLQIISLMEKTGLPLNDLIDISNDVHDSCC